MGARRRRGGAGQLAERRNSLFTAKSWACGGVGCVVAAASVGWFVVLPPWTDTHKRAAHGASANVRARRRFGYKKERRQARIHTISFIDTKSLEQHHPFTRKRPSHPSIASATSSRPFSESLSLHTGAFDRYLRPRDSIEELSRYHTRAAQLVEEAHAARARGALGGRARRRARAGRRCRATARRSRFGRRRAQQRPGRGQRLAGACLYVCASARACVGRACRCRCRCM